MKGYGVIVAQLKIVIGGNCIVVKIAIGMCIVLSGKDGRSVGVGMAVGGGEVGLRGNAGVLGKGVMSPRVNDDLRVFGW